MSRITLAALVSMVAFAGPLTPRSLASDHEAEDLRSSLLGAWRLVERLDPGAEQPTTRRLKFWGETNWTVTGMDLKTNQVLHHHGGSFVLDGNNYSETISYGTAGSQPIVGRTFHFQIEVDGDTYKQIDPNGHFSERWERLRLKEPSKADD